MKTSFIFIMTLALGLAAVGHAKDKVEIDNTIEKCVDIDVKSTNTEKNLVTLDGFFRVKKSVDKCGCAGSTVQYKTLAVSGKDLTPILSGEIYLLESRQKILALTTASETFNWPATIWLGCVNE